MHCIESLSDSSSENHLTAIAEPLLLWYRSQARILPWREHPLPYEVWISEIMLQQTRVEAAKPYFDRFIAALPDLRSLAEAPPDDVLKLWEGLGYYNRARNLQKAAQETLTRFEGNLPASFDELLTLPGIGRYTAGAIASIAYGIPEPAVDGNVLRVIARVLASRDDIAKERCKRRIEDLLRAAMPKTAAGTFNQALMELGAMVCLPRAAARCGLCPLKQLCLSKAWECAGEIPIKSPKKARRIEEKTVFLFHYKGRTAFQKRADRGLLAGMWELPNTRGTLSVDDAYAFAARLGLVPAVIRTLPSTQHKFTHIEWQMTGYAVPLSAPPPAGSMRWVTAAELAENFAVPTAFKAYTNEIISPIL